MVGRSGDLRRIIQPHWEALCGLLGNARMTPYAQKRGEAGWPVWADTHGKSGGRVFDYLQCPRKGTESACFTTGNGS